MELFDFLEKKLIEHGPKLCEIEKERQAPLAGGLSIDKVDDIMPRILYPEVLEAIKDELLELKCFKNTKKINIVTLPVYLADKKNWGPSSKICN